MTDEVQPDWRSTRSRALVGLAAESTGDRADELVPLLEALCRAGTTSLSLLGGAVNLMSRTSSTGVVAASDSRSRALVEMQFETGEGPCHDAFRARRPVLVPDLRDRGAMRWPGYTALAVAAGVRGVFAYPLQLGGVNLGVLDLFREKPGAFTDEENRLAVVYAQLATEILLDGRLTTPAGDLDPDLDSAMDLHPEIHQAQGILVVLLQVDLAEALARMRAFAFGNGVPLTGLAREIVAGRRFTENEI